MKSYSRRGDLAGPVLLIGFGALLLLINLGRIPVSLWGALSQLWPLALIVLGLDLLIPRRSILASILVAGLLLGVAAAGAALALPALTSPPSAVGGEEIRVPATGDAAAEVSLIAGAGSVRVGAVEEGDLLVGGHIRLPGGGQAEQLVEDLGNSTTVLLRSTHGVPIPVNLGRGEVWQIGIHPDPRLELSTQLGAGEIFVDARELDLEAFDASAGAGEIEVILPGAASTVKLSAAVGQLTIRVPEGMAVRMQASTLAGSVQVPEGYKRVGGAYVSPGFAAGDHIEIDASLVFGTIIVIEP